MQKVIIDTNVLVSALIQRSYPNFILELAYESNADFIITGNTNDFTMSDFHGTKIINPKDFWDTFKF